MQSFTGKTVVITGAGSGIGQALAVAMAREGARLALIDRDPEGLAETMRLTQSADTQIHVLDVADRETVFAMAGRIAAEAGPADVVINNAGVSSSGRILDYTDETLEWTIGVNLWGVIHGVRAFLPQLLTRPEAALVNVSSVFGLLGVPGQAAYCASKFAVRGFTEALRQEMRGTPVTVTLVFPGGVRTGIARHSRSDFPLPPDILLQGLREFDASAPSSPEQAAAAIMDGIRKKKPRVLIGRDARVIDRLARLFPGGYDRFLEKSIRRSIIWRSLRGAASEGPAGGRRG